MKSQEKPLIYMDNGATSWPKPPEVAEAVAHFINSIGANPGRAGHRLALEAGRVIYNAREELADFFGLADPMRLVFTPNVTTALNLVIRGMFEPEGGCGDRNREISGDLQEDRVVCTSMEHNGVMRPLRHLESRGLRVDQLPCDRTGLTDPALLSALLQEPGPVPRLVIINHASNVTGTLQPLKQFGTIVRNFRESRNSSYPLLLVDAAQSAGSVDINMERDGIDILTFTGHKGLLGPTGTGGVLFAPSVNIEAIAPLVRGGTGSRSEEEYQPPFLPDRFEAGTANGAGLAGLLASLRWVRRRTLEDIRLHEAALRRRLYRGLSSIPGLHLYGPGYPESGGEESASRDSGSPHPSTGVLSFTLDQLPCSEIGLRLDDEYGILCRVGLHCAPGAHKSIGTFPEGTVRLAPGPFTTEAEIDRTIEAVAALASVGQGGEM